MLVNNEHPVPVDKHYGPAGQGRAPPYPLSRQNFLVKRHCVIWWQGLGSPTGLEAAVGRLGGLRALVVGDVVLDVERHGRASSLAPEGPVPLVTAEGEELAVGGAGNAVAYLRSLGVAVSLVTVVGDDSEGSRIVKMLSDRGVDTSGVVVDRDYSTVVVERISADGRLLLRIDRVPGRGPSEEAISAALEAYTRLLPSSNFVVISDHRRGLLTPAVGPRVVDEAHAAGLRVFVNPKADSAWNYVGADFLRMNLREASLLTGISYINETSVRNMLLHVKSKVKAKSVAITWLEKGSYMLDEHNKFVTVKPLPTPVLNLVGIGDLILSATAALSAAGLPVAAAFRVALGLAYLASASSERFPDLRRLLGELVSSPDLRRWAEGV